MTLAQIFRLALRQLDEDPADISDFEDLFFVYANQGYQIALKEYYKPRETMTLVTDKNGNAVIEGLDLVRIIALKDANGREIGYEISTDGTYIHTNRRKERLTAVGIVVYPEMESASDVPNLPQHAHAALADYICYRYLSKGNLAKQSRAQFFQNSFYQQMRGIAPQASGSVTGYKNLYETTEANYWG